MEELDYDQDDYDNREEEQEEEELTDLNRFLIILMRDDGTRD